MKYEKKYGNWIGKSTVWLNNTSLIGTFIQPLQKLGVNPGQCDVYHDETPDGRWIVTFVQNSETPSIKESKKIEVPA